MVRPSVERAVKILKRNEPNLTVLDLNMTSLVSKDAVAIAEALRHNKTLTTLDLFNNSIGHKGAKAIAKALQHNTTLVKLDLGSNSIGVEGANAIAEALQQNTTLTELYLGKNSIGYKGAKAVAEALQQNTTLTTLNLWSNSIGYKGAKAVAEALGHNTTLAKLNLGDNCIGNEGAVAIVEALGQNMTLSKLNLSDSCIGNKGADAIAEGLRHNTTLTELDLHSNSIGTGGGTALLEALAYNSSVSSMDLFWNENMSNDVYKQIQSLVAEKKRGSRNDISAESKPRGKTGGGKRYHHTAEIRQNTANGRRGTNENVFDLQSPQLSEREVPELIKAVKMFDSDNPQNETGSTDQGILTTTERIRPEINDEEAEPRYMDDPNVAQISKEEYNNLLDLLNAQSITVTKLHACFDNIDTGNLSSCLGVIVQHSSDVHKMIKSAATNHTDEEEIRAILAISSHRDFYLPMLQLLKGMVKAMDALASGLVEGSVGARNQLLETLQGGRGVKSAIKSIKPRQLARRAVVSAIRDVPLPAAELTSSVVGFFLSLKSSREESMVIVLSTSDLHPRGHPRCPHPQSCKVRFLCDSCV